MKYCVKCGTQNADSAKFCTECGTALAVSEANDNTNYTYETVENTTSDNAASSETTTLDTTYTYGENTSSKDSDTSEDRYTYTYNADSNTQGGYTSVHPGIAPRNIVVAIILSFVTCGIYQLYWMFKMNDEVNVLASEPAAPSGGIVILLHIVTCGIYGIYWSYKMGERCDRIKGSVGGNSAVLYLILALLGFGIVNFCLIQDTINKAV